MKSSIAFILILLFFQYSLSQSQPKIYILTTEKIIGSGRKGNEIGIDSNNDKIADHKFYIPESGKFEYHFIPPLRSDSNIDIWTNYTRRNWLLKKNHKQTDTITYKVNLDSFYKEEYVRKIEKELPEAIEADFLDTQNYQLKNTILSYKAKISNTYFQIPIARFNFSEVEGKEGDISLFSSVGAGFGLSWGRMEIYRDHTGQVINEEFSNTVGVHLGALFSAGTGEDSNNIFAPTFNVSILDFQVGVGYELGTVSENQKRLFVTLAYGIPLYKLVKKSYRIWKLNPIPYESRTVVQE